MVDQMLLCYIGLLLREKNVKSLASLNARREALTSVSLVLSQTPVYTVYRGKHRYEIMTASRGVFVYVPGFARTHCTHPHKDDKFLREIET